MAGLTLTTADAVLKEDYLPGIREQLNNDTFLAVAEKNSEDITGRRAVLAAHVARNGGVGSRAELGALPAAGNQSYTDEYIPLKYHYARIQISGQTIKAMASDATSFTRAVRSEMDGSVNDLKRELSRQCFGTSDGKIAQCGTTTGSTTVNLAASATAVQGRQIAVGDVIDIGTVANPVAVASAVTVTAVTFAGSMGESAITSIVVSGSAVTTSASHFIFRAGSGGSGANQKELTGLQTTINNAANDGGAVFNINSATYPIWQSYRDDNSGTLRSVSETMFAKAQQGVRINGGADMDFWVASDGVHRAYAALLTGLKRFPQTVDLKGGYKGLDASAGGVNSAPITWDRDCPSNTAFGIRSQNLIEFRMSDWEWMDQDGAVLQRVIGYDAYEATLFKYAELATDKRNAHAVVKDLTEA